MTPEEFLKKKGYYAGSLMLSKVKGQGLVSIAQALQEYADEVITVTRYCESDSELLPKRLSNEAYKKAQVMSYAGFVEWWDEQQV